MLPTYKERFVEHNINGKVLVHCDLDDLKKVSSNYAGNEFMYILMWNKVDVTL